MFGTPCEEYEVDPVVARALDLLLILHADHEQNCSTSTVRLSGSSQANMFASISAPLVWDLELEWEGGGSVRLVKPSKLPDLYAGRPVTIVARVTGDAPSELRVRGTTMEGERTFTVDLSASQFELPVQLTPAKPVGRSK